MRTRLIRAVALTGLLLAAGPALFASSSGAVATVGWFLNEIAAARQLGVRSESEAPQALRDAGVPLPAIDPAKDLTEGDVVAIGRAVGVAVTSQSPETPFDRSRARAFIASFRAEIGGGGEGPSATGDARGEPNENSNNGKGKKKGHNNSASEPLAGSGG